MDVENDDHNLELSLFQGVTNLHLIANRSKHQDNTIDQKIIQDIIPAATTVLTIPKNNSDQNNRDEIPPPSAVGTKPPYNISDFQQ